VQLHDPNRADKPRQSAVALKPLLSYLPILDKQDMTGVIDDLALLLSSHINQNRVFVPCMQTISSLIEGGLLEMSTTKSDAVKER